VVHAARAGRRDRLRRGQLPGDESLASSGIGASDHRRSGRCPCRRTPSDASRCCGRPGWGRGPHGAVLAWILGLRSSYPQRTGDYATVTRLSDFYTPRELAKTDIGAFLATAGTLHEILLPLPPDGEQDRRVLLFRRPGADFTDRDVLLLTLLRPHIYALFQRQQRRGRGEPELTPRQLEILKLVAVGRTNAQIARALCVSEATVGKHLENIYTRLGVTNRMAAASAIDTLNIPANLARPTRDQHTA